VKANGKPKLERLMGTRLLGGFQKFERTVVRASGHPMAFATASGTIVILAHTCPLFHFGNTWLLVMRLQHRQLRRQGRREIGRQASGRIGQIAQKN